MNEICIILGAGQEIKYFKETVTITCMKLVLAPHRVFLVNGSLHCWCCNDSVSPRSLMAHWVSFCHTYPRNEDPFSRGQASVHCITSSPKNRKRFLSIRQPSVVLSTVYTVGIVEYASILLTQTSWLGRSTLELNLWFVLILCQRSYPLFNYPLHL